MVGNEKVMQYAIELYYDKETEQKLYNLAKRVADEKLSTKFMEWKTRSHLTLACTIFASSMMKIVCINFSAKCMNA